MRASGSIGLLSSTPKRSASTDLQDLWRQTWSSMDKGGTAHSLQKNRGGRSICRHWQITKSLRKLLTNSIIHMALMPLLYILMTSIVSQENWWGHSIHFGYHIFISICRESCMFSLATYTIMGTMPQSTQWWQIHAPEISFGSFVIKMVAKTKTAFLQPMWCLQTNIPASTFFFRAHFLSSYCDSKLAYWVWPARKKYFIVRFIIMHFS